MTKQIIVLSLLAMLGTTQSTAFATDADMHCNFAPKNDVKIPIGFRSKLGTSGLTEDQYNAVIDRVENYYKPIVQAKGATLTINRMWDTDEANSTAHRSGNSWFVDAYGGLARYAIMTPDAEMAVLCHEMGHHLGGYPKTSSVFGSNSWASNEGQADYFATMKCFRLITANDDNSAVLSKVSIPQDVKDSCSTSFKSAQEIAICERESLAGKVLAQILFELGGSKGTGPDFNTPDTSTVSKTNNAHPEAQCRLDTYFNGSICQVDPSIEFGTTEGVTGACAKEAGATFGYRPSCWYAAKRR